MHPSLHPDRQTDPTASGYGRFRLSGSYATRSLPESRLGKAEGISVLGWAPAVSSEQRHLVAAASCAGIRIPNFGRLLSDTVATLSAFLIRSEFVACPTIGSVTWFQRRWILANRRSGRFQPRHPIWLDRCRGTPAMLPVNPGIMNPWRHLSQHRVPQSRLWPSLWQPGFGSALSRLGLGR